MTPGRNNDSDNDSDNDNDNDSCEMQFECVRVSVLMSVRVCGQVLTCLFSLVCALSLSRCPCPVSVCCVELNSCSLICIVNSLMTNVESVSFELIIKVITKVLCTIEDYFYGPLIRLMERLRRSLKSTI